MYLRNTDSRLVGVWPTRLEHGASGRSRDAERGLLLVPSSRQCSESAPIALSFVRVPAKEDHGLPPLIVLDGGPGGAAIARFEGNFFDHVDRLSEVCDVVTFDQRGCHSAMPSLFNPYRLEVDLDQPMTRSGYLCAHRTNAGRLASYWQDRGVDLNHYNTVESAQDVDDLRKALGLDRINLHGASYGSHLGLAVIKAHAEVVERAILCLVEGLDDTHKLPANTDRHFDHLTDLARSDPGLHGQCPDLVGELRGVLADYEARPATLALPSLERSIAVGKFDLQLLLDSALGSIRAIRGLPAFVRQLANRDVSMVARRIERRLTLAGIPGMMLAMDAASGASPERSRQIEAERGKAVLDDAFNLPFPFVADVIGVDDLGAEFRTPVEAQTPTLFCCGTLDGRTPISNARAVMRGFPNAHLIVVEGTGHETPNLLLDAQVGFLAGEDVRVERLSRPFAFDPIAPSAAS